MTEHTGFPITYLAHSNQWKLKTLLEQLFIDPKPDHITEAVSFYLRKYPVPMADFPPLEGTYSRTMLFRSENGYEAMAARWSKGAVTSIHGHPHFALILVAEGALEVETYDKNGDNIIETGSGILYSNDFFSDVGFEGKFDNHVHKVTAIEETLSIHISSDDASKGRIFTR